MPEYVPNQIYSQLITRIGLLTAKEVENVIDAYLLAAELPVRLKLLTKGTAEFPGYIQLSDEHAEVAAKMHESFLVKINMALASLRNEYKKEPHNKGIKLTARTFCPYRASFSARQLIPGARGIKK
ncbi:MAG: hypothetical protein SWC40_01430 [Thermodesulfobacteriota bacterium]|nr:hypothetical protein [Thermodesulfobacteriota bacterium]